MNRYVPPPIGTLDQSQTGNATELHGTIRDMAFKEGYGIGEGAGYSAGFAEGTKQSRAAADQEISDLRAALAEQSACQGVAHALEDLMATRTADRRSLERDTRRAMRTALEMLFPTLCDHLLGEELVEIVGDSLAARGADHLTIRAAPATIEAITARGLPTSGPTQLVLVPDINRQSGAAEITWSGGGLMFDPGLLLHQINEILLPESMRKDENYV